VSTPINRRGFLGGATVSAALLALRPALAFDTKRHFAPVKVARNRVIREVVGLRPYRPGGFVVDAQRFGNKLLVHNYGHGGGGVTLSWGTASLAVDMARDFLIAHRSARPTHFAVLGCGVSGLSTARLLQRRFQNGPGTVNHLRERSSARYNVKHCGRVMGANICLRDNDAEVQRTVSNRVSDLKSSLSIARGD
jgi:hypothetical protein